MSHADLSEADIKERLDVLEHNLGVLEHAATALAEEDPDDGFPFLSLAQAFAEEANYLQTARDGTLTERALLVNDMLANLATIREEADDDAISRIDERVAGSLKNWD